MYRISKQFEFSAAHHLPYLPAEHPCSRPHGHNYVVEIVLEADEIGAEGFVEDYRALGDVKAFLDSEWDHRDLNVVGAAPYRTTAEMLAWFLYDRFHEAHPALAEVRVSETTKTWASYRPSRTP
jgi:6-pyruvoyltetrahydropterin/6-carboxytetrahydropterin synthase